MTPISRPAPRAARSQPLKPLRGQLITPSDKSVSHRALILGALANGTTRISGLLESDDVLATAEAVSRLGASVVHTGPGNWTVTGRGGRFRSPDTPLDFGNSGTGVRLMMGAVAGAGASAHFIGDSSLSSRPMGRVTEPLMQMGADITANGGRLPVQLNASILNAIDYRPPVASAQVKSAILLAALGASGETIVREDHATRDHTETMLKLFGAGLTVEPEGGARIIRLGGPQGLTACDVDVPGDPSSAAFATIAALIIPGSDLTLSRIMTNPARTGLYEALCRMGADLSFTPAGQASGEHVADLRVRASQLSAIDLEADIAPSMIDEYPVLAVACAFAKGTSRLRGLAELRAKESDRLAATCAMLTANGAAARIDGDDLVITGGVVSGGGEVITRGDHRMAMSALVLGMAAHGGAAVDDITMIATSYPAFMDDMSALGARLEVGQ